MWCEKDDLHPAVDFGGLQMMMMIHINPHVTKKPYLTIFLEVKDGPSIEALLMFSILVTRTDVYRICPSDKKTYFWFGVGNWQRHYDASSNFSLACVEENMLCQIIYLFNKFPRFDIKFPGNPSKSTVNPDRIVRIVDPAYPV